MASWRLGYVLRVRVSVELFYSKPDPRFQCWWGYGVHNYDVRVQILGLFPRACGADLPCRCPSGSELRSEFGD